jgi:hypothetical protein
MRQPARRRRRLMRRLVYYISVTLDGFIAGPGGGDPTLERSTPAYVS